MFSEGYVRGTLIVSDNAVGTAQNIMAHTSPRATRLASTERLSRNVLLGLELVADVHRLHG